MGPTLASVTSLLAVSEQRLRVWLVPKCAIFLLRWACGAGQCGAGVEVVRQEEMAVRGTWVRHLISMYRTNLVEADQWVQLVLYHRVSI